MNSITKIFTPVAQRRLEGVALLVAAIVMYGHWQFSWKVFALCLFLPDLPILLYLKGPGIGEPAQGAGCGYGVGWRFRISPLQRRGRA